MCGSFLAHANPKPSTARDGTAWRDSLAPLMPPVLATQEPIATTIPADSRPYPQESMTILGYCVAYKLVVEREREREAAKQNRLQAPGSKETELNIAFPATAPITAMTNQ